MKRFFKDTEYNGKSEIDVLLLVLDVKLDFHYQ